MAKKAHLFLLGEQKTLCGRRMDAKRGHIGHVKAMMPYPGMKQFSKSFICQICERKHRLTSTQL